MDKVRRILALSGVILLLGLYGSTLVFAIIDNSDTMSMFKASIVATVIVPVLLWIYTFIYRMIKKNSESQDENKNTK